MALIHKATLHPTKLEILTARSSAWHTGPVGEVRRVASFRFDDPAGEVGIETMLVTVGDGPVHQVPLTYRDAALAGADEWLLGTSEHSVLGKRWVYDGAGDPVYAAALASAILGNTGQAEEFVEVDGRQERREPDMTVSGNGDTEAPAVGAIQRVVKGDPTLIVTDTVELTVLRRLGGDLAGAVLTGAVLTGAVLTGAVLTGAVLTGAVLTGAVLTGTWPGQPTPAPLASATLR